jgi:17beta-estradiol 17-dehydrogenase/3alpha(17beta)-hydroxysteroid dehydrogenase (NAD+)
MLANKLALVTGGASGIGNSIARLFAMNGANIVLVDMVPSVQEASKLIQQESNSQIKTLSFQCDVSNSTQVNQLFEKIRTAFPDQKVPNVVVNSAGITRDGFMLKMSEADFDKVIQVNLKGSFLILQAAARGLVEQATLNKLDLSNTKSYGSIINLASVVGKFGNIGQVNYSASKAGVEGMTRTTAKEMGRFKIRCNAILPGFIRTPMTEKVPDKVLGQMVKMIPLGRFGEPEDIAQLALFLASDASSYVTGASIECSGGIQF